MRLTDMEKFNILYFFSLIVLILINVFLESFYFLDLLSTFIILALLGFNLFIIIKKENLDKKDLEDFSYRLGFGIFLIGMIYLKKISMFIGLGLILFCLI